MADPEKHAQAHPQHRVAQPTQSTQSQPLVPGAAVGDAPVTGINEPLQPKSNETIPGGKYVVDGKTVNASGEEIDDEGKPVKKKGE